MISMTRNKRILISIVLLVLMCVSVLATLSACSSSELVSGTKEHKNGLYYTVYPLRRSVVLHGFDVIEGEQVYTIPSYVRYKGIKYPVTKLGLPKFVQDEPIDNSLYSLVHGGYAKELVVPKTVKEMYLSASDVDTQYLEKVTVNAHSKYLKSVDGVLYSADGSEMLFYPPAKNEAIFTIPKEVTSISSNANFNNSEYTTDFKVEAGNEKFREFNGVLYSFDGSSLLYYPLGKHDEKFIIPKEYTPTSYYFFRTHRYIKYFEVEEGHSILCAINGDLYTVDGSVLLYRQKSNGTVLEIPSSTRIIGENTLDGIEYLYIPISVEKVVFYTSYDGEEVNIYNPIGQVKHVYFESSTLPFYLRHTTFVGDVQFGITREQFNEQVNDVILERQ